MLHVALPFEFTHTHHTHTHTHSEVCEDYNLKFCSSLPGYNDTKVYINNEQGLNLADIEHKMSGLYFPLIDTLSAGCQLALRQIICHTALPFCKTQCKYSTELILDVHCIHNTKAVLCYPVYVCNYKGLPVMASI